MKKLRAFTAVFLVSILALALLMTGCGGKEAPPATTSTQPGGTNPVTQTATATTSPAAVQPEDVDIPKLLEDALNATSNLTTFKMVMEYNMDTETIGGTEAGKMAMQATSDMQINIPEKKMAMIMTMTMDMEMGADDPSQMPIDTTMEMYTVDGWAYTKINIPMMGDQWMKVKMTDEDFAEQSQIGDMSQFLESAVDYEIVGSEVLNGVDCYIVKVTPEMNVMMDWAMSQQQTGSTPELTEDDMDNAFKSFEVKAWIAKDSKLMMREMITMSMEIGSEAAGDNFEKMIMNMSGKMDFYDHGKPITITLPPEALNAPEMPGA